MRYTVTWEREAVDRLAALWTASPERGSFAKAINLIEHSLRDDPASKGEEYYGDRIFVAEPLMVTFQVEEDDRVVVIIDIWCRSF